MLKKTNLKILSILITTLGILFLIWIILNRKIIKIMDAPISAIGNIPENHTMFLIGATTVLFLVVLFLIKIHKQENKKIKWELYVLSILIILTLITPYKDELLLMKIIHTITGTTGALTLLYAIHRINKYYALENKTIKKITNKIPIITIIGTLTLFIITGLSTVMQLFYLTTTLIWINLIAFSKPQKKTKKTNIK